MVILAVWKVSLLPALPAPGGSLGRELSHECKWIPVMVLNRVPSYPWDLPRFLDSRGNPSSFCCNHYPSLNVTGLLCVPGIMPIQSIHPRKRRLLGKLRKLRFRKEESLSLKIPQPVSDGASSKSWPVEYSQRWGSKRCFSELFSKCYPKSTGWIRNRNLWSIWNAESQNTKSKRGGNKGSWLS